MPYWKLYYHAVWATKDRLPMLTPEVEPVIFDFLRRKASGLGAIVFALNGTLDHVHLVAAIPPKIAVAKFIGQIKAVASTKFNKSGLRPEPFFWQDEYGVFSFDAKRLPNFVGYVERQKEHHAQAALIPALERADAEGGWPLREPSPTYTEADAGWRREMEIEYA